MRNEQGLHDNLMHPLDAFTPIPFWFWNDEPDEETIQRQLKDYVDKGVNGLVIHPRIGIPKHIEYLSEGFFDVITYVVRKAEALGMWIILYDEGMYPSGSAHGKVVEDYPEYASKGIRLVTEVNEPPDEETIVVQVSKSSYIIKDHTKGTIRGIHFGEDDGQKEAPMSADILNPYAVERFIRLTHERYYERLAPYFGSTIIGFFTDEPSALGRNTEGFFEWTEGMKEDIQKAGGTLKDLIGLFRGEENGTTQIYHQCVKKYLRNTFYQPLSTWCEDHGISLYGHPAESDDIEEQLYFHVPGQDLIMRRVRPLEGGIYESDSVHGKLSADIARHLGRQRNANECFGVCAQEDNPWHFTAQDMKWYIDWLGMRGVNLYIPHAFYYSLSGERKNERPPDVGPNNIWWPHYRRFSDYMKRLSYLMTDSHNQARIAVLCDNNHVPYQEVALLYENQIPFNYLPVGLLEQCRIEGNRCHIKGYAYETLVDLLGEKGQNAVDIGQVNTVKHITQAFCDAYNAQEQELSIVQRHKDLRQCILEKEGMRVYLFSNEGKKKIQVAFRFEKKSQPNPIGYDLWEGESYSLHLEPEGESYGIYTVAISPCDMQCMIIPRQIEIWEPLNHRNQSEPKNWQRYFNQIDERENRRIYEYLYNHDEEEERVSSFIVEGEEMVECYCNNTFVDVSFWNPHIMDISGHVHNGNNRIRLEVTGSAANQYASGTIKYGLDNA